MLKKLSIFSKYSWANLFYIFKLSIKIRHIVKTLDQMKDIIPLMEKELSQELKEACDNLVPPGCAVADFLNSAPWMKGKIL